MNCVIPISEISEHERHIVGDKAFALSVMSNRRMPVPRAVAVTVEAYHEYITSTRLSTVIMMELHRKSLNDMRWEEMWDASLRIRNAFLNTPVPLSLMKKITPSLERTFAETSVVVRSSAPGEDAAGTSFAGLHSSFVNVKGTGSIIDHVKLVWASLWSDAALLYRKELGLDESKSAMAVVIQEIVSGDVSGIGFGQSPDNPAQSVIEAVYGLNQGLVDGTLEPDRWILDRGTGTIISHAPAGRERACYPVEGGTELRPLTPELRGRPPLDDEKVKRVYGLLTEAERIFGMPQDVEWTIKHGDLYVLQSRPITTAAGRTGDDNRGWYLSLKRSFEHLKALRRTIEHDLIPALRRDTGELAAMDVGMLNDDELSAETGKRKELFVKWKKIYWDYFIPFAHGMRLFGTVYNDTLRPRDPFEFISLLSTGKTDSIERNNMLETMAAYLREKKGAGVSADAGTAHDSEFTRMLNRFITSYGGLICSRPECGDGKEAVMKLVNEMAVSTASAKGTGISIPEKEREFFSRFSEEKKEYAGELLDLGRASYIMRDNDNIYMGMLKAEVLRAEDELRRRLPGGGERGRSAGDFDSLSLPGSGHSEVHARSEADSDVTVRVRQITGQPAGPGLAVGHARVIRSISDLMQFRRGEVLVCDAIDPSMTFVVPLAAAIVERRGGMLIHGAIIAREYGLPCVTGIAAAAEIIRTGDRVTVDGYLGIVIVDSASARDHRKK